MEEVLKAVSTVGFPIAVAVFVLTRIEPISNTTPLKIKSYVAGTVIQAQVANQSGVAGNTIYLFGFLY